MLRTSNATVFEIYADKAEHLVAALISLDLLRVFGLSTPGKTIQDLLFSSMLETSYVAVVGTAYDDTNQ